jgi:flagellar export protein FliJ
VAFQFRLAAVLRHRKHVEDVRGQALARAIRGRDQILGQLAALRAEAAGQRRALADRGRAGTDGATLASLAATIQLLDRLVAAAARELAEAEVALTAARRALVEASRERRLLEVLERTQRDAHDERVQAARTRELDDIASRYHQRHLVEQGGGGS